MKPIPIKRYLSRLSFLSSIPVLALALYIAAHHAIILRKFNENTAFDKAYNISLYVDRRVETLIEGLQMLAASPLLDDDRERVEFYTLAGGFLEGFGAHVILADTDMNMLLNTRSPFGAALPKLPVPKGHAAAPEVLRTGRPSVGDTFMGPIAGERLIAVVVPVVRQGGVRFLLLASVEVRQFQNMLDALALPSSWQIRILDSKGDMLAQRIPAEPWKEVHDQGRIKRFGVEMENTHWNLVLDIPRIEHIAPIRDDLMLWSGALVLAILASQFAGAFYGKRLIASVRVAVAEDESAGETVSIAEILDVQTKLRDLHAARERYSSILELFVENAPAAIAMFDTEMRYMAVSRRFIQDYRLEMEDLPGRSHYEIFPEIPERWKEIHQNCLQGAVMRQDRDPFPRADGKMDWISWEIHPWREKTGVIGGMILFSEVVTERVEAEERTKRSLAEKEVLIRELYHRTNNNMQSIQAMMVLQSQAFPDMPLAEFTRAITRKIEAMALVHRRLCDSVDVSRINLGDYLRDLSELAFDGYSELRDRVRVELRLEDVFVLFDTAVPIGFGVLELLTNALKHAFPGGRSGRILLTLSRMEPGNIELLVSDDGIGMSGGDEKTGGRLTGLGLAQFIFRDQLKGSISRQAGEGTAYLIRLSDTQYNERVAL